MSLKQYKNITIFTIGHEPHPKKMHIISETMSLWIQVRINRTGEGNVICITTYTEAQVLQVSIDPNISDKLTDAQDKAQPVKHFPATKNVIVHKAIAVRLVLVSSALLLFICALPLSSLGVKQKTVSIRRCRTLENALSNLLLCRIVNFAVPFAIVVAICQKSSTLFYHCDETKRNKNNSRLNPGDRVCVFVPDLCCLEYWNIHSTKKVWTEWIELDWAPQLQRIAAVKRRVLFWGWTEG